jgi:hypothetical protein
MTAQMTSTLLEDEAPTSRAVDPTARARISSMRRPALVVALLLLVTVVIAVGRGGSNGGYMDPGSANPAGARALRVLLEQQGVTVVPVTDAVHAVAAAKSGDTLLLVTPQDVGAAELDLLAQSPADLVLVDPTPGVLARLAPALQPTGFTEPALRDPVCDLPAAQRAGRAVTGGISVTETQPGPGDALCYAVDGAATVARVTAGGRTVTVVGSGEAFTNDALATEGDAALALNLLGVHARLVWYVVPNTLAASDGTRPLSELLPRWVRPVELQLLIAVLLLAAWQGRRFGRVVEEPLPVVVRAAEATEGRARLYRRSGARDRAAQNLRAAARSRLIPLVGQGRGADRQAVVDAVSARTGRPATEVAALLYGAAPTDDAALVRLAGELDALERMVRRP